MSERIDLDELDKVIDSAMDPNGNAGAAWDAWIGNVRPLVVGGLIDRISELEALLSMVKDYVDFTEIPGWKFSDDIAGVLEKGAVRRG